MYSIEALGSADRYQCVSVSSSKPPHARSLNVATQSAEVEEKVEQLLVQAAGERDPDLLAEINAMADAITRLEKIEDDMRRDNSAYLLSRNHIAEYYGFRGTSLEQEMLQVMLDGSERYMLYQRAIFEVAPESLEAALAAARVVRDRAILAKDERKDFDMQLMVMPGL